MITGGQVLIGALVIFVVLPELAAIPDGTPTELMIEPMAKALILGILFLGLQLVELGVMSMLPKLKCAKCNHGFRFHENAKGEKHDHCKRYDAIKFLGKKSCTCTEFEIKEKDLRL